MKRQYKGNTLEISVAGISYTSHEGHKEEANWSKYTPDEVGEIIGTFIWEIADNNTLASLIFAHFAKYIREAVKEQKIRIMMSE